LEQEKLEANHRAILIVSFPYKVMAVLLTTCGNSMAKPGWIARLGYPPGFRRETGKSQAARLC
jgi:hypothetical protein